MYISHRLKFIWILCPFVVTLFSYGAMSWIFSFSEPKENHRRFGRSVESAHSYCDQILPSEFFKTLQSDASTNCQRPIPTENDCMVAQHVFKSDPKTKICRDLFSSVSFQSIKCYINSKFQDCWTKIHTSCELSEDYQCHIFYENNKNNTINQVQFGPTLVASTMNNLGTTLSTNWHETKSAFALSVCRNSQRDQRTMKATDRVFYRLVTFENRHPEGKAKEPKRPRPKVNLVLVPSLSRAGFYRFLHGSQTALRSLRASEQAHVVDFSMYQSKDLGHLHNYLRTLMGQGASLNAPHDTHNRVKCELFKASSFNGKGHLGLEADLVLQHFMDTKCSSNKIFEYFECLGNQTVNKESSEERTVNSLSMSNHFRSFVCRLQEQSDLITPLLTVDGVSSACSQKWLLSSVVIKLQLLFSQNALQRQEKSLENNGKNTNIGLITNILRTPFERDIKHSFDAVDISLADHIEHVGRQSNVVTFLLSERGFVHPIYSKMASYGKIEQENPIFFMILPSDFVRSKAASQFVSHLHGQQSHLLGLENIHSILQTTVQVLANQHNSGSFKPSETNKRDPIKPTIHKYRHSGLNYGDTIFWNTLSLGRQNCESLGIRQPNLCLCENEYIEFSNDTVQVGTAEFAIGEMNKLLKRAINSEYRLNRMLSSEIFTHSPYGYCNKLQGIAFKNVQITHMADCVRTKLDVYVMSKNGQNSDNGNNRDYHSSLNYEKFYIIVDRLYQNNASVLKLTDYKRIPPRTFDRGNDESRSKCNSLGIYEDSLCICDSASKHKYTFSKNDMLTQLSHKQFGMIPMLINVHGTCLFLVIRHYMHSAAFEAANVCEGRVYELTLHYHTKGMLLSGDRNVKVTLQGMEETFMGVAMQASYHKQDAHVWYTTTVSYKDLR